MSASALRVGIIAPPWLPVPPMRYGGTEAVIDTLSRGLKAAGQEVVLFTNGDSTCAVERRFAFAESPGIDFGGSAVEMHHVIRAYEELTDVDVIHDHTMVGPLYSVGRASAPVVTTNHNSFADPFGTSFRALGGAVPVIAISAHHASTATGIPIAAVIHHGVEPSEFAVGTGSGGYALFLGRMCPEKGAHRAVAAAKAAGVRLLLAGRLKSESELRYFEDEVRPFLGEQVSFLGEVDAETKHELLGGAICLLNPIAWDEPFGMVMIEAFACGTPVIALRAGSSPEIVDHGVTGLLCDSLSELVGALSDVRLLDRAACRQAAEGHFSAARMVADHLQLYAALAESVTARAPAGA